MATKRQEGTIIIHKDGAGAGEIEFSAEASLTTGVAWEGTKFDFGATFADLWRMDAMFDTGGTAPGAGETLDIYIAYSPNSAAASENPGGVVADDTAYTGYTVTGGSLDDSLKQLAFIGSIPFDNCANQNQQKSFYFTPMARYGTIIVDNNTAQTLGTGHKITLTELKIVSD